MPHIVLEGQADLAAVHTSFQPASVQVNGWLVKFQQCFLASTGKTLMFQTVATRSGFVQSFYILAENKNDQLSLRIDPHTNVEKNEGVKRSLAVAMGLIAASGHGAKILKTNLPAEFLETQTQP